MVAREEDFLVLSSLPPSRTQRRLALVIVLLIFLLACLINAGTFSAFTLLRVEALIPIYAVAMILIDSITAFLLFTQASMLRSRALLAISNGYLFTALIIIPWLLSFPGVFARSGVLDEGLQTTVWLYTIWHAGFPLFIIAYALLRNAGPATRVWQGSASVMILSSVTMNVAFVCAATFFVIAGQNLLPRFMLDEVHFSILWDYMAVFIALLCALAIIAIWIRRSSLLDLWLMVVMFVSMTEVLLSVFPNPVRYSVGWYAGRVCGLLSGSLILFVLLHEITKVYARLIGAIRGQSRERDARLITGDAVAAAIAHEVKQPLSGMITSADAGLRFLNRSIPDFDEAKDAFKQIVADGHRAAAVIGGIRALFKQESRSRVSLDLNKLIHATLALTEESLEKHRIQVIVKLDEQLPQVAGDQIQLQQVLVNLITNAIESMAATDVPRALSVKSEIHDNRDVTISVADSGTGIGPQDIDQIFNPLYTTKSNGMGMGLSICRSIIEAHDGRLWVLSNVPRGAVFCFRLARSAAA